MSIDANNLLREITNLENSSKNCKRQIVELSEKYQSIRSETDRSFYNYFHNFTICLPFIILNSVKKTIEENRMKEKEQIKQLAQLDHRISTAKERATILQNETNAILAQKEKERATTHEELITISNERYIFFHF